MKRSLDRVRRILQPTTQIYRLAQTTQQLLETCKLSSNEEIFIKKHGKTLFHQAMKRFFVNTGKIDKSTQMENSLEKTYGNIETQGSVLTELFPFLKNSDSQEVNIPLISCLQADLLGYLVDNSHDVETILLVLRNLKITLFQHPRQTERIRHLITPNIQSSLDYLHKTRNYTELPTRAENYLSTFETNHVVETNPGKHLRLLDEMSQKHSWRRKWALGAGVCTLSFAGILSYQTSKDKQQITGPMTDPISYPRITKEGKKSRYTSATNTDLLDTLFLEKSSSVHKLYSHSPSGRSIRSFQTYDEYDTLTEKFRKIPGGFDQDTHTFEAIRDDLGNIDIDWNTLKNEFYEMVNYLRGEREPVEKDLTYGFIDEIRVENLPKGIAGLFKRRNDDPTDKDIYLDTDLVKNGNPLEISGVIIHEGAHALLGTAPYTIRNEGFADALTHHVIYHSRGEDLFTPSSPYAPHVLGSLLIHTAFGKTKIQGYEPFDLHLQYDYRLVNSEINGEYNVFAQALLSILKTHPQEVIDPTIVVFFTGGVKQILRTASHELVTPETKKGFEKLLQRYKESPFQTIEHDSTIHDEEKISLVLEYITKNKTDLFAPSPSDEMPGNSINVGHNIHTHGTGDSGRRKTEGDKNTHTHGEGSGGADLDEESPIDLEKESPASKSNPKEDKKDLSENIGGPTSYLKDLSYATSSYARDVIGVELLNTGEIDPNFYHLAADHALGMKLINLIGGNSSIEIDIYRSIYEKHLKHEIGKVAYKLKQLLLSDEYQKFYKEYSTKCKSQLASKDSDCIISIPKTLKKITDELFEKENIIETLTQSKYLNRLLSLAQSNRRNNQNIDIDDFEVTQRLYDDLIDKSGLKEDLPRGSQYGAYLSERFFAFNLASRYKNVLLRNLSENGDPIEHKDIDIPLIKKNIKERNNFRKVIERMIEDKENEILMEKVKNIPEYHDIIGSYIHIIENDSDPIYAKITKLLEIADHNKHNTVRIFLVMLGILLLSGGGVRLYKKNEFKKTLDKFGNEDNEYGFAGELKKHLDTSFLKLRGISHQQIIILVIAMSGILGLKSTSSIWELEKNYTKTKAREHIKQHPLRSTRLHTMQQLYKIEDRKNNGGAFRKKLLLDEIVKSYNPVDNERTTAPYNILEGQFDIKLPQDVKKNLEKVYRESIHLLRGRRDRFNRNEISVIHHQIESILKEGIQLPDHEKEIPWRAVSFFMMYLLMSTACIYHISDEIKNTKYHTRLISRLHELLEDQGVEGLSEESIDILIGQIRNKKTYGETRKQLRIVSGRVGSFEKPEDIKQIQKVLVDLTPDDVLMPPSCRKLMKIENPTRENIGTWAKETLIEQKEDIALDGFETLTIDIRREKLLSLLEKKDHKKGLIALYEKHGDQLIHGAVIDFVLRYLPRIGYARANSIPLEVCINSRPYTYEEIMFSSVRFLKSSYNQLNGKGAHSLSSPILTALMKSSSPYLSPDEIEKEFLKENHSYKRVAQ